MYDTDDFSDDIENYIAGLDDEEFDNLLEDISKELTPEQDRQIIRKMIQEGNWWNSLMDIDDRGSDE